MKKLVTMLLALLLLTTAALAESSLPQAVQSLVPETAVLVETDRDDGLVEYEFRDGTMTYEVVMRDEAAVALTVQNTAIRAGKQNLLTQETATQNLPGTLLYAAAEKDDGRWIWKVILQEETDLVEYELNAETGEVMEVERYFSATLALPEGNYRTLDLELDDGQLRWDWD